MPRVATTTTLEALLKPVTVKEFTTGMTHQGQVHVGDCGFVDPTDNTGFGILGLGGTVSTHNAVR